MFLYVVVRGLSRVNRRRYNSVVSWKERHVYTRCTATGRYSTGIRRPTCSTRASSTTCSGFNEYAAPPAHYFAHARCAYIAVANNAPRKLDTLDNSARCTGSLFCCTRDFLYARFPCFPHFVHTANIVFSYPSLSNSNTVSGSAGVRCIHNTHIAAYFARLPRTTGATRAGGASAVLDVALDFPYASGDELLAPPTHHTGAGRRYAV